MELLAAVMGLGVAQVEGGWAVRGAAATRAAGMEVTVAVAAEVVEHLAVEPRRG